MFSGKWTLLQRLDLRFSSKQEKEFRDSLQGGFVLPGYFATVFVSLICSWNLYHTYAAQAQNDYSTIVAVMQVSNFLIIGMSATTFVLVFLRQHTNYFAWLNVEMATIVYASLVLIAEACGNSWHLPLLFGERPELVFPVWEVKAQEGPLLLSIATWSCGSCLVVPIRAHLSWIVAAVGLSILVFVSVFAGSPHPEYLPSNVSRLVCILGFNLRAAYISEQKAREEWLAQRTVKHQQVVIDQRDQAMSRILNTFCDCLLQMASDFTILEPCPRLAAMLMCRRRNHLQGSSFLEYFASEHDRTTFVTAIRTCDSIMDMTPMIPIHLRDSSGMNFRASLYYTSYHDKQNCLRYLIGVVESESRNCVYPTALRPLELASAASAPPTIDEDNTSKRSSSSSVQLDTCDLCVEECAVTFRVGMDGFHVVSCSPNFTTLTGPLEDGQCLMPLIDLKCQQSFVAWAQDLGNSFMHARTIRGIILRSPGVKNIRYKVKTCRLDEIRIVRSGGQDNESCDEISAEDDIEMRVAFEGVQMQNTKQAKAEEKTLARNKRVVLNL
eukprot:TRINITY_DN24266_c0_g1_i1.p1 TRINITY_DN24266_c0_g1~~TRINITY_DN24266_c0_g1_i1.p1  ORF type:complete len:553 (+),score=48.87 TRINITY_DN24266_c0_g1_i1:47-1705(+)